MKNTLRRARRATGAAVLGLALGIGGGIAAAPDAHAISCEATWGSLPKTAAGMTTKTVVNVRAGQHVCFDRLVIDLGRTGTGPVGYRVAYGPVVGSSGMPTPLRGGATIAITVNAPAYDNWGRPTYSPANRRELVNTTGYRTFRQVAFVESFEGYTTVGLGVRARLPMRAFVLSSTDGTRRLVVDVQYTW